MMSEKVEIKLTELRKLFEFLEQANSFLHQPMNYESSASTRKWVAEHYPTLQELYYGTVWNWLPKEVQTEYEQR